MLLKCLQKLSSVVKILNGQQKYVVKQHIFCRFAVMKHILLANGCQVAVHFSENAVNAKAIPLVLLHGFCEDSSLWGAFLPQLKEIPVIMIDLPGFGQSDLPTAPDIATYAQAVLSVLDSLEVKQCMLVGHSLGGYVALEFGARWGERLVGMGLFHSHPFPDNEERKMARMRGVEMLRSGKRDLYVSQLFPNLFSPAFAQSHPEVVNDMIKTGKKQSPEGIVAALLAMSTRHDHQQTLKDIACPVLLLLGAEDGLIPVDQGWQAALLPTVASIEIMPGVAHMGMFEAPDKSAAVLQGFYSQCMY